jgi:hypothetical protein
MTIGDWYMHRVEAGWGVTYSNSWVREYVKLHKQHEANRTAWRDREKNLAALRAKQGEQADR